MCEWHHGPTQDLPALARSLCKRFEHSKGGFSIARIQLFPCIQQVREVPQRAPLITLKRDMLFLLQASGSLCSPESEDKWGRVKSQLPCPPKPGHGKLWSPETLRAEGLAQRRPATIRVEAQRSIEGLTGHHQAALIQMVKTVRNERTTQESRLRRVWVLDADHDLLKELVEAHRPYPVRLLRRYFLLGGLVETELTRMSQPAHVIDPSKHEDQVGDPSFGEFLCQAGNDLRRVISGTGEVSDNNPAPNSFLQKTSCNCGI